jgi:hypothetical protein
LRIGLRVGQNGAMPREPSNVVPIRPKPRKWTRPEDFGHDPRKVPKPPKPPRGPKRDWSKALRTAAIWALIVAIVAGTVGYSLWG